jgi:hypothetical protein
MEELFFDVTNMSDCAGSEASQKPIESILSPSPLTTNSISEAAMVTIPKDSKSTGGLGAVDVDIMTTLSVRKLGVAHEDRNTIIMNSVYSFFMNYYFLFRV